MSNPLGKRPDLYTFDPNKLPDLPKTPIEPGHSPSSPSTTINEGVPPPTSIPQKVTIQAPIPAKQPATTIPQSGHTVQQPSKSSDTKVIKANLFNYMKAKDEYKKAMREFEIERNKVQMQADPDNEASVEKPQELIDLKEKLDEKQEVLKKVTPYAMKSLKSDMGTIAMIFKGIFFAYEAKKLEYNKLVENKDTAIIKLKEDKKKQIRKKINELTDNIPQNVLSALTQVERFEDEEIKLKDPNVDFNKKNDITYQRKTAGREIKGSIKNYTLAENYRKSEVGKLRTQLIAKEKTLKDENITEDEIKAFLSKKKASVHSSGVAAGVLFPFIAIAASAFLPLWGILAIGNAVCSEITGGENLAGTDVDQDEKISDLSKQAHEKASGSGA